MTTDDPGEPDALADVSFPSPRDDCVAAVRAARSYVHEQSGARRTEIVNGLEPETNHRIGVSAAQALGKLGDIEAYREWWWTNVVEPGLRALPDIEAPATSGEPWRPVDSVDSIESDSSAATGRDGRRDDGSETSSAFESVRDVQEVVDEGALFELAYREDDSTRRVVVTFDGKLRPAALPVDSPPAFRFRPITGGGSFVVRLPDVVELRPASIEQLQGALQTAGASSFVSIAEDHPARIPLAECATIIEAARSGDVDPDLALSLARLQLRDREEALEELATPLFGLLEAAESPSGRHLLLELDERAADEPSAIAPHVTDLATLATETPYSTLAARCLATVAEADPTFVIEAVPTLATALESGDDEARRWVVYTCSLIADEYPEELLPALDGLVDAIRSADENLRGNALSAIGKIAGSYPGAAEAIVTDLVGLLDDESELVRANAVGLLGDVAQEHPGPVVDQAAPIAQLLTDPAPAARLNASLTLLRAGEADPQAIRERHDQLEAALSDESAEVRANACTLVGNSGAPVSVDRLRDLRENDPDETVRERAGWAVERST